MGTKEATSMRVVATAFALAAAALVQGAPVNVINDQSHSLESMDLGVTVFDQSAASSADTNKNYVIFAFDNDSCAGENAAKCAALEHAMASTIDAVGKDSDFQAKYGETTVFGKANKDSFPDHKKDFEKARVPLPAVLFWPSGHSRPSCKYDKNDPSGEDLEQWLVSKLHEEEDDDDSLLQIEEGITDEADDDSMKFCRVDEQPKEVAEAMSNLVQTGVEKTDQIWSYKDGSMKYFGPADNSLPKDLTNTAGDLKTMNAASFQGMSAQNKYMLVYFKADWCKYCGCLPPIFEKIAGNLITSKRQPNLLVTTVDGDKSPALRDLFQIEVYPTILLVNRDATKVMGRYLGPRKVYEISNWVEDLIVADENPIVKYEFDPQADKPATHDAYPVFPYEGKEAFGDTSLMSLSTTLMGNDEDECTMMDEAKFTSPGAALLIHYGNEARYEMDGSQVSTSITPDKVMVIDFYEPWCPHCQKLHPVWDEVAKDFEGKEVIVGKVNLENHPDVKKQFGIHKFPTIVYFEPGQPMRFNEEHRYKGKRQVGNLEDWVTGLVPASKPATPPMAAKAQTAVEMKPTEMESSIPVAPAPAPAPAAESPVVGLEAPAPEPKVLPEGAST